MTYGHKLFEADLVVFVAISFTHQLVDDLPHLVARQREVGLFEQLMELKVADEAITVEVCHDKTPRMLC